MELEVSTIMKCVLTRSNGNDAWKKKKNINPELARGLSFTFKIILRMEQLFDKNDGLQLTKNLFNE